MPIRCRSCITELFPGWSFPCAANCSSAAIGKLRSGRDGELSIAGPSVPSSAVGIRTSRETISNCNYVPAEIRIERQLLLARNDDLLFLADAVIGPADMRIDCVSRLPLVPGLDVRSEESDA